MESFESEIHQVFVKLLDGKHKILNFNTPSISVQTLKRHIQTLTSIPSHLQLLRFNNSRILHDQQTLTLSESPKFTPSREILDSNFDDQFDSNRDVGKFPVVLHLLLRLRGGKGGFGSLLRGAATKAGQKKTNNFDACRDMSGRRLRHVNAEKKLEEWRAEADERKLEKMAEEYIKKKVKEVVKSGKSKGGDGAEKYVEKYREVSAKCREDVERSVRESIKGSKRKGGTEEKELETKRAKIWFGKRKLVDSDSDSDSEDMDEDDIDKEEEDKDEKSVVINNGNLSDSSKEAEGSSGSITGGTFDAVFLDRGSSSSEEEKEAVAKDSPKTSKIIDGFGDDGKIKIMNNEPELESRKEITDHDGIETEVLPKSHSNKVEETVTELPGAEEASNIIVSEPVQELPISASAKIQDLDKPLNFDEYNLDSELEVLGMERLKLELQSRGLKCGGTLQERASRLFLLKTMPIAKLPMPRNEMSSNLVI